MPMNQTELNASAVQIAAANTLEDKKAAFIAADAAATAANSARTAAVTALDTAWVDYKTKDASLDGLLLTPPANYAPPA